MTTLLTVRDEATGSAASSSLVLEFLTEHITVRELIRGRVYQEVQDYNRLQPEVFHGLVPVTDAERALNGDRVKRPPLDWQRQFDKALAAFEAGRFLILVDERQAAALDDPITIQPGTAVTFLRLTPLVGG